MEKLIVLVPVAAIYALGAAIAVFLLLQVLVWAVQSAVNGVVDTVRGLRLLRQYLRHRQEFEAWFEGHNGPGGKTT